MMAPAARPPPKPQTHPRPPQPQPLPRHCTVSMLLVAAFLIASAPPAGAAAAALANDGTTTATNAAAISFVIVFDIVTPLNEFCSALCPCGHFLSACWAAIQWLTLTGTGEFTRFRGEIQ